jgi:hypothetical protein
MSTEAPWLGVGLDWAEDCHDVALGTPGEGVIEQFRIEHGPAGVARLVARCLALEPDPAEVRVPPVNPGLLWHCLRRGVTYNEATHAANRARALKTAT